MVSSSRRTVRIKPQRSSPIQSLEAPVVAGVLLFILGGSWDVAWHVEIGRDTFWSPPHLLLYAGILTILSACAFAFVRAWRVGRAVPGPGPFISALGAGLALASAPIDDLWHRLYGLDVTILSPPHVMLIGGMAVAAFGALTGFAVRANRADPARLETLWRSTAAPWRRHAGEAGIYLAGGTLTAIALAVTGEYAFDISRYPVEWHPVMLSGLAALTFAATTRAGGRIGGATLTAAAYTLVLALAHLELALLGAVRPQLPLILLAAPAMDLVLWRLARRGRWVPPPGPAAGQGLWAAALAGVAFTAVLLLVQWPYTTAMNAVVWRPDVLGRAALPAMLAGAAGAALGWLIGASLRPVALAATAARPGAARRAPPVAPRWNGWTAWPGLTVGAALLAVLLLAIIPAALRAGAPPDLRSARSPASSQSVGTLELSPAVPVAGQALTARLTLTDPALITDVPALPFESPRAGDVVRGVMRATGSAGTYEVTFTPREPGRRWLSVFVETAEGRQAASALFVVYQADQAAGAAPISPRAVVLRPEPGPQVGLPVWLEPATYTLVVLLLVSECAAIVWALRRAARVAGATGVVGAIPRRAAARAAVA